MEIEIFTLCDAAADYQGRLSILGVFDTIFAATIPAVHPQCSIALRLRVERIEDGAHNLTLHIVDTDGKQIVPEMKAQFTSQMAESDTSGTLNLVLNLHGLTFPDYGDYAVNLAIDSRREKSMPFWVKPIVAQPHGGR